MKEPRSLIVYVDVDDTLVRTVGTKWIPITGMVRHVRDLSANGVVLYAWSSGGADYAREAARELGIEHCFQAFLPKPNVIIDDQAPAEWRRLIHVYPAAASSKTIGEYSAAVYGDSG
jgi:hypothetical protein